MPTPPSQTRSWWVYGVSGTAVAVVLAGLTLTAVLLATWFVVLYARVGPIPGQTVIRPVDNMGGLVGQRPPPPAHSP